MTIPTTPNAPTPAAAPGEALSSANLQTLLKEGPKRVWWRRTTLWIIVGLLVLSGVGYYFWQASATRNATPVFVTEPANKGNLTLTVAANGTIQPTRSVSIGSELSGTVLRVLVDVNDQVKKGQVLVELDTAKLSDQVARSRAALSAARAQVAQAVATVSEAQGNLGRLEEVARLSGGKVPSKAELDSGRATLERAQAEELSARANVVQAQATVSTDETNLSKASIRSPTDGVVLTRTVDPGNAVAASLQAVTLFTVAEDLSKLRLQVNVDEADVGSVKVGQKARFTVSAYPARNYPATITRVAFGSTITENVVTYITYMEVDNKDLSLRPGMTASATITSTERNDVLLVPNTALRFSPSVSGGAAGAAKSGGIMSSLLPRMPRTGARKSAGGSGPSKQVWVLRDGAAVAVDVKTGISDGRMTEITGGELQPGMLVITDQRSGGTAP
ncbi:secretion protein HlyD [Rhodoferax ferrireducens T118]|uniref:Secretion protein HlyD n=1 Tax=Albidiferax ferrireducens (strain ATCC BAA-621 / DSM 15236 / T118) TaxID=338969 RepID=Q21TK9_ALBFT|nr:efflux RND transporter periplasmic adaptor subunit [Rhodoferax ferrireducens]ABD70894.1 secretion protein HlyD [Rhodoferax ferrireducens T118]